MLVHTGLTAVFAIALSAGLAAAQATVPMTVAPAKTTESTGDSTYASADDLLRALESADVGLRSLKAGIIYEKTFSEGDRQVRNGTLHFVDERSGSKAGGRKFAAVFDEHLSGTRHDKEKKVYIFDGKSLVEKTPSDKKMVKTEIARRGEDFDPLKIGEGPMPIPIGQKREDILSRFEVELLGASQDLEGNDETETEQLREHVKGAHQLKLTPKGEHAKESKFAEIRLWYRKGKDGKLLPRMARGFGPRTGEEGDEAREVETVRLLNVKVNEAMPSEIFSTATPEGWDVVVR